MRLATVQTLHEPRVVGIHADSGTDRFVDLCASDPHLPSTLSAILALEDGLDRARAAFAKGLAAKQFVTGNLLAPLPNPGKVFCIGLNYRDHALETKAQIPGEPIVFSKFSSAIVGPGVSIILPRASHKVDYEAELVVVIGRRGKLISASDAPSYIAGYMIGNDVSARDWQTEKPGKQWLLGKTPDTFGPTGPWMVTADEIPDPCSLGIRLRLNGQTMQDSTTKELIFSPAKLIEHITKVVTIDPGDIIFTGTPPGVGVARTPPVFLKDGDQIEVEIDRLGVLKNPVRAE
ncbi:MAG TPA: fumarylacetoacetate hydrolase family protein [Planctomycetaceae bacterium]|jgi:2-keto-4-pentenoate hydratase/2-oxohepta-3-ene-1,7-dioic acid hydratase in catechol pathway|nr:fumarylacetoacetate hydrolase family protein [Planctomycetaceae bacterium]